MKKKKGNDLDPEFIHALSKYEKQSRRLAYKQLPPTVIVGMNEWDLSHWTLITTDHCLCRLVQRKKKICEHITAVDLANGDKITNRGLDFLAYHLPNLTQISLENIFQINEKSLVKLVKCCEKLRKLTLSGCLGISGTGFAILGQHACGLTTLRLSGCTQITPWAFMKIFQGCKRLAHLDISYCAQITDHEVKILSDSCGDTLEELNLKECRQVSDVGSLSLKACRNLSTLVLARSDLVSRITDVSLLAISEGCCKLTSLDISGCEMITDVGLSWLAKGCRALRKLNLSHCAKITNGGLRYFGEECKELQAISLVNVKKVSDVGLRHLAKGCPYLRYLNASGVHLITDGVNRDFGHEGLQSMGEAECAKRMRMINLHGCFHVKKVALRALASMNVLDSLVLSNCSSLTVEGMASLSKSCRKLSHLSLASCGECVTNEMLEIIFSNMQEVRTVDISDCVEVGRKGLRKLSRCSKLVSLNLSGCRKVCSEAMLILGEGQYFPGVRELYLNRCNKLDDTALSWIVESFADRLSKVGAVTLVTLALRGTKVTHRATKAVRDRFQYSSLKKNDAYFGFLALNRYKDRMMINKHYIRSESASKIQAVARGLLFRRIVAKAKEHHIKGKMVTKIAAIWRGWLARSLARALRLERWRRHIMAVKIQCFVRNASARTFLKQLKHKHWRLVAPESAIVIQKAFRGYRGRLAAVDTRKKVKELEIRRRQNSIKIQCLGRILIARMKTKILREKAQALQEQKRKSTIHIQTLWRIKIARGVLEDKKVRVLRQYLKEQKASRIIFRSIRKNCFRNCIHRRVQQTRYINDSASMIQGWLHEQMTLIKRKRKEELRRQAERNSMASMIQSYWRMKAARLLAFQLRIQRDTLIALKRKKGLILTRWWRGCQARLRLRLLRQQYRERLERKFQIQTESATHIASCWRGHLGRNEAREKVKSRKSRWKQMWSDQDQCHFYYNQLTGESRWRKPQDLLDLDQRPVCNNCEYYDAQFECASCEEYYCSSCWNAVHYGGRRKNHLFRSLYDYYGKRVDYGDGEFPSKWPSEIEQDEHVGWHAKENSYMCRIATGT